MADSKQPDGIVLTEAQKKSRRQRSIAIALALGVLVFLVIYNLYLAGLGYHEVFLGRIAGALRSRAPQ